MPYQYQSTSIATEDNNAQAWCTACIALYMCICVYVYMFCLWMKWTMFDHVVHVVVVGSARGRRHHPGRSPDGDTDTGGEATSPAILCPAAILGLLCPALARVQWPAQPRDLLASASVSIFMQWLLSLMCILCNLLIACVCIEWLKLNEFTINWFQLIVFISINNS